MTAAKTLRNELSGGKIIAVPGAFDALSARIIEQSGFRAAYMTGLGATASRLGMPDLALMTQTEMAEHARSMTRAVGIPVIADADTGYGGPLNIRRAIGDYVQAGVAAFHLEDQVSPKRCGQLSGVRVVEITEAENRLKAAMAAREEFGDIVAIARTDALSGYGIHEALERAKRYAGLGADLTFVDGVKTIAEVEQIASGLQGPKVVSIVDGTDAARLTLSDLQEMGFSICLFAVHAIFAVIAAQRLALSQLAENGRLSDTGFSYAEFCDLVGLAPHQVFAHKFEGVNE